MDEFLLKVTEMVVTVLLVLQEAGSFFSSGNAEEGKECN